jgi:nucleoside-diphosphate-sugar epimerase
MNTNILITGACGQIGSDLTVALGRMYGQDHVIASDIVAPSEKMLNSARFEHVDTTDIGAISRVIRENNVATVYHLVTLLSAASEGNPQKAWYVNVTSLTNVLEVARENACAVFAASSPAVFGPGAPRDNTPQDTILRPVSIYGVSKVAGELLCDYYHSRYGVDTRGLRFSGVISYETIPTGGITDYAVGMFYEALKKNPYHCFLREGTCLPFMYIPDAIKATITLMEADPQRLIHRNSFNVTAMSLAPEDVGREIQKHLPEFSFDYKPDSVRQAIADSGTTSLDDTAAREEWGWQPDYDLAALAQDMLIKISEKLNIKR